MQSAELVIEFEDRKSAKVFVAMVPVILGRHFRIVIPTIYMEGLEIVRRYHLSDEHPHNPSTEKVMLRYRLQDPRIICLTLPVIPSALIDLTNYARENKGDYICKDCDIGY